MFNRIAREPAGAVPVCGRTANGDYGAEHSWPGRGHSFVGSARSVPRQGADAARIVHRRELQD